VKRAVLLVVVLAGCRFGNTDSTPKHHHRPVETAPVETPPAAEQTVIAVGERAPDIDLPMTNRTGHGRVVLGEVLDKGNRALVVFYRGAWCEYCKKQLADLQASLPDLEKRHVVPIGVSVDLLDASDSLAASLGVDFPLAEDASHKAIASYGVYDAGGEIAKPAVFLVERDHKVSWRFMADDFRERPSSQAILKAIDGAAPAP
jgi:peroxiredoxin